MNLATIEPAFHTWLGSSRPANPARRAHFLSQFLIDQRPDVVAFLTQHIVIPRSMSPAVVRGATSPFSLQHQGFARFILECANPGHGITDVTVASATQVFKTFGLLMMLIYRIVHAPSPKLIVFPTKDTAQKAVSRKKLQPLINCNPILSERKPANSDHFTDMEMDLLGGAIRLTGTNSPSNLASTSEQDIFQDEVCKFEHHSSEDSPEAHPMDLADERAKSFGRDAFRYKSSSPNIVTHPFWTRFEAGSQTHFLVTCPNCSHLFPFEDWPDKTHDDKHPGYESVGPDYRSLVWSPDAKDTHGQWIEQKVRETIRFICPRCAFPIEESQRLSMLDRVEEIHLNPGAATTNKSFRLPSFYSPALTFGDVAWNRIKPSDLFDNQQNHQNSWLANCWQQFDVSLKLEAVNKCVADGKDGRPFYLRGTLPFRPLRLLLNADPGEIMTNWEIVAVAKDGGIWVIDWGTVLSSQDLLNKDFLRSHSSYTVPSTGEKVTPDGGYIDTGWQQDDQLNVCELSGGFFTPVKGSEAKHGTVYETRVATRPTMKILVFSDREVKNALYYNRMLKGKDGGFHLPADADPEVKLGHTGQQRDSSGDWKKVPKDHYGDDSKYGVIDFWLMRAAGLTH